MSSFTDETPTEQEEISLTLHLDSEDFLVSNLLLPIGSLVFLLFCVSKWGWGFDKYLAEANKGERGPKLPRWLKPYFQWVLPILILVILIQGLL